MSGVALDIGFVDNMEWQRSAVSNFHPGKQADIWRINVIENLPLLSHFREVLNRDEIARAGRYLRKEDQDRFIISRASLRYILSKYTGIDPAAIVFEFGFNKKPYISNTNIQYNLSDSGDQVVIAIAATALGIDIEYIKPRFYYDTILPLNFTAQEIAFISQTDSLLRFFMLWTRKEAILKASGIGLTDHLKQIPALNGKYTIDGGLISTRNSWRLSSFVAAENYIATIATDITLASNNFYEFDPTTFLN